MMIDFNKEYENAILRIEAVKEYCIVNKDDQIVKDGFYSEEEAAEWMEQVYGVKHEPKPKPDAGGWILCSGRTPYPSEHIDVKSNTLKRLEIAYETDTIEYIIGYYDGGKWFDKHHNIIKNVIAWKLFLPLPEPYHE